MEPPIIGPIQAANFGSLIPTESPGCRGDMLPRHHPSRWDYLQERLYRPESPLARGYSQKFIARGYHTTGADLCTTGSKKHELNLSKARSAGVISMSLFVPLLEFNHFWRSPKSKIAMPEKVVCLYNLRPVFIT